MTVQDLYAFEPLIRVGLVLPNDDIRTLQLTFSHPDLYSIVGAGDLKTDDLSPGFSLSAHDGRIRLGRDLLPESTVSIIPSRKKNETTIRIDGLRAGRGFHWEKRISASFWGALHFKAQQNRLVVVNELPLEWYLSCVATSEMGAACPVELLKAQTVVARSWLLASAEGKHAGQGYDACNDDCCQRYQGMDQITPESLSACESTAYQVMMHNNEICDTRYSKSCGGRTENADLVWSMPETPYLQSIKDANEAGVVYCSPECVDEKSLTQFIGKVDEPGSYFSWTYRLSQEELMDSLKVKHGVLAQVVIDLEPLVRGPSGRITRLRIVYEDQSGIKQSHFAESEYDIRDLLCSRFLYSSAFEIEREADHGFVLKGKGWGHGVGLCQIGALGMALDGCDYIKILTHYFKGASCLSIEPCHASELISVSRERVRSNAKVSEPAG